MAFVSVIVPFYNQIKYLETCLKSVINQTISNVEIILVDDGSIEDPWPIVEKLNDVRIKVIRQPNGGVARARNTAIASSSGDYLVFLDADDWLAPTMIQDLASILDLNKECGLAYCDIFRVSEDGKVADELTIADCRPRLSGDILPSLLCGGYFPPVSVLLRSSVLREVGEFDPHMRGCCDWDLWIRIAVSGFSAKFHSKRLAYYRLHDKSMSKDIDDMKKTAFLALQKNTISSPEKMARALSLLINSSNDLFNDKVDLANFVHSLKVLIGDGDLGNADLFNKISRLLEADVG